jgi:hypothetical protein
MPKGGVSPTAAFPLNVLFPVGLTHRPELLALEKGSRHEDFIDLTDQITRVGRLL